MRQRATAAARTMLRSRYRIGRRLGADRLTLDEHRWCRLCERRWRQILGQRSLPRVAWKRASFGAFGPAPFPRRQRRRRMLARVLAPPTATPALRHRTYSTLNRKVAGLELECRVPAFVTIESPGRSL